MDDVEGKSARRPARRDILIWLEARDQTTRPLPIVIMIADGACPARFLLPRQPNPRSRCFITVFTVDGFPQQRLRLVRLTFLSAGSMSKVCLWLICLPHQSSPSGSMQVNCISVTRTELRETTIPFVLALCRRHPHRLTPARWALSHHLAS